MFDVDHRLLLFVTIGQDHGTSIAGADGKFFKTAFIKKSLSIVNTLAISRGWCWKKYNTLV
jgi:hypothetical protein